MDIGPEGWVEIGVMIKRIEEERPIEKSLTDIAEAENPKPVKQITYEAIGSEYMIGHGV